MAAKKSPSPLRYAVWNNKGGVGKTFLSFVIAAQYAEDHPEQPVVIVDMCPQANVSEIVLGGNGKGAETLNQLLNRPQRKTVGGYFDQRINQPHARTGTESSYLVTARENNSNLPKNLYIVAGDPSLEVQTQAINQIAGQSLPSAAWANVHRWLLDMLDGIAVHVGSPVFFLALPSIHLVPLNRSTQYDKKASKAFSAMYKEIQTRVLSLRKQLPHQFSLPVREGEPFLDIPDAHSVSVVVSHEGVPLSKVALGVHDIHGVNCQVNQVPLDRYKAAVARLVSLL